MPQDDSRIVRIALVGVGHRARIIRGALDTQAVKNRKQARSLYGAKKG